MPKLILLFSVAFISMQALSQNDNCFGNSYNILQNFETTIDCPSEDWKLVFHDEFHGTALNTDLWYTYTPFTDGSDQCTFCRTHPNEGQIYLDQNVAVNDGTLKLISKREAVNWMGEEREFSSGKIQVKENFRFKEGKFEIRCKVPSGKGFWPAFWLYRFGDEVDVFEIGGDNPADYLVSIHTEHGQIFEEHCRRSETIPADNLLDQFHTYSLEWERNEIRWLLDGETVYRMARYTEAGLNGLERYCPDDLELGNYLESFFFSEFDMSIIANLAIPSVNGNSFTDYPDSNTVFPSQMEIDYIRVYQRNPQNGFDNLCHESNLVGPDEICGISTTYQFNGPFDELEWEVSSNLMVEVSEEDQITVYPLSNGIGFVLAKIDVNNLGPCASRVELIEINVAVPIETIRTNYQNGLIKIFGNCNANTNESAEMRIFDRSGRLITTQTVQRNFGNYSVPFILASGVYIIRITGTEFDDALKLFVP